MSNDISRNRIFRRNMRKSTEDPKMKSKTVEKHLTSSRRRLKEIEF